MGIKDEMRKGLLDPFGRPPTKKVLKREEVQTRKLEIENIKLQREADALERREAARLVKLEKRKRSRLEKKQETYNTKAYLLKRRMELDEAAVNSCIKRPNSQLFKVLKQLSGELVEKTEVTHKGLSADDIDRINKKADAELEEFLRGIQADGIQEV